MAVEAPRLVVGRPSSVVVSIELAMVVEAQGLGALVGPPALG